MVYTKYTETKPVEYHFTKTITFDFQGQRQSKQIEQKNKSYFNRDYGMENSRGKVRHGLLKKSVG